MFKYLKCLKYFKGICLIAGTCIGAGMIGVPVKTAAAGFYPTLMALGAVWLIMTGSALLLLEVSLSFPGEHNFLSMTHAIFGKNGKKLAWFICLLFLYAIMAAFASGGASMLNKLLVIDNRMAILVFMLPFAIIIYLGTNWVSIVNRILTMGIILFFILLCISMFKTQHVLQPLENFSSHSDFKSLFFALPLLVTTFSYHEIIPSVKSYLKEDLTSLKVAILLGGFIPLVIYIIWELVVLLLVPVFGSDGLINMLSIGANPGDSLVKYLLDHYVNNIGNNNILICIVGFSFCALTCSLTGTAWALSDFFADGFNTKNRLILSCLTFVPPVVYAMIFPQGFLKALGFAGAFSAIIMIIYPSLMAYKIRTNPNLNKQPVRYKAPIGKLLLGMIFLFGILILILEGVSNFAT